MEQRTRIASALAATLGARCARVACRLRQRQRAATTRSPSHGDVPLAYVKRVNTMGMNPTDGTPIARRRRPDAAREVVGERGRAQPHRPLHAGQRRRLRPRGLVRRQEDRLLDELPDDEHVDDRRPAGLHRRAGTSGNTTPPARRCRPARFRRLTALDRGRRRRPGLPAGRPRLRVLVEPPDQVEDQPGDRPRLPRRSTSTSASACSTCTRWTPTAARSRRSRSTRATTATRWCGRTATSCSRAGSTSAPRNRFAIFRIKPDGTDMFVLYGAQSPGNSFLHPRDMDPAGQYAGFLSSSLMSLSGTQEGGGADVHRRGQLLRAQHAGQQHRAGAAAARPRSPTRR